jgi:hypothetical protein
MSFKSPLPQYKQTDEIRSYATRVVSLGYFAKLGRVASSSHFISRYEALSL